MKATIPFLFITIISLCNCKKDTNKAVAHINCDGLLTDTPSTGNDGRIYMQNAFTPNNDGLNDISRPIPFNINSLSYTIYDGSNNIVYSTNQLLQGWSTTVSSNTAETFYYKIQATTNNGYHIGMCGELYKLSCFPSNIARNSVYFEDQLLLNGTYSATTLENLPDCP